MGFVEAVKSYYLRYADFETRSSRSEYWWVQLYFFLLVFVAVFLILGLAGMSGGFNSEIDSNSSGEVFTGAMVLLFILFIVLHIIPSIAVTVRRFHDQDKSGWFYLFSFIPYIGGIIIFVFMLLAGTRGDNRFGPDPLGDHIYDTFS